MDTLQSFRRLFRWRFVPWKRRSSSMGDEHIKLVDNDDSGDHLSQWAAGEDAHQATQRQQRIIKAIVVLVFVVGTLVAISQLPVKQYLLDTSAWIKTHTFLGTFVAIAIFVLAIPLCVPSTIVEALSGSMFGVAHGSAVIIIGKTGGSLLTFLIGRRVGNAVIGDYLATNFPTFRALSTVLNSASWKPLVLFQLSSIPNLIKCYGLAVTKVSGTRFALSAMVANIPHAIIWANIGNQASDIAAVIYGKTELSRDKLMLLIGGGVLTVLAMTFLVVYTKRELQQLQKQECASGSEDEASAITIAIDQDNGLPLHSDENELSRVRSNTLH